MSPILCNEQKEITKNQHIIDHTHMKIKFTRQQNCIPQATMRDRHTKQKLSFSRSLVFMVFSSHFSQEKWQRKEKKNMENLR